MQAYSTQYRDELLQRVVPFWLEHSVDREYGGYFTSLERDGTVFDTDKWVWLQGREVWTLVTLYNLVENAPNGWKQPGEERNFCAASGPIRTGPTISA